jgi:thiaminase
MIGGFGTRRRYDHDFNYWKQPKPPPQAEIPEHLKHLVGSAPIQRGPDGQPLPGPRRGDFHKTMESHNLIPSGGHLIDPGRPEPERSGSEWYPDDAHHQRGLPVYQKKGEPDVQVMELDDFLRQSGQQPPGHAGLSDNVARSMEELEMRLQPLMKNATNHPFHEAISNGTLSIEAFESWLVQNRHLHKLQIRLSSSALTAAPEEDVSFLSSAIGIYTHRWEEDKRRHMVERDFDDDMHKTAHKPAVHDYALRIKALLRAPYLIKIVTLYTMEKAISVAFHKLQAKGNHEASYAMWIDRWSEDYSKDLYLTMEGCANKMIDHPSTTDAHMTAAEETAKWVLENLIQIWNDMHLNIPPVSTDAPVKSEL